MEIQKFQDKVIPAVMVHAVQLTAENAEEVAQWCGGMLVEEIDALDKDKKQPGINVPLWRGRERASLGDYVYLHPNSFSGNDFYVSKPDTFHSMHDPAE